MPDFPENIQQFLSPETDRLLFLQQRLLSYGVDSSVICLEGNRHLFVNFPPEAFNPQYKINVIAVHYDRVENSPGANDNSLACLVAADFAKEILERAKKGIFSNIRIFFTDGEEKGKNGVFEQGSYTLAQKFKNWSFDKNNVFVFDSCGRGNVAVLAKNTMPVSFTSRNSIFVRDFSALYTRASNILSEISPSKYMILPVPYSDNAGFLASGIPAVQITFLPENEVSFYLKNLMNDKNLEKAVMNRQIEKNEDFRFKYLEKMPVTWRLFHTPYDNLLSLTIESATLLKKIFRRLLVPVYN